MTGEEAEREMVDQVVRLMKGMTEMVDPRFWRGARLALVLELDGGARAEITHPDNSVGAILDAEIAA